MRVALGVLLAGLAACRGQPRSAAIGLAYGGYGAQISAVAQPVLDSLPGAPAIRLVTPPDTGPPEPTESAQAVRAATALTADPTVIGTVGPGSSRDVLLTAPIYDEAGVPQIVPTGTAHRLQEVGPWTFLLSPDDSAEGEFIAAFIHDHFGAAAVSIFAVADEYGSSLRATVIDGLERRGITVADVVSVPTERSCRPSDRGAANPLEPAVTISLRRARPPVALLLTRTQQTGCLARLLAARSPGMRFVAGDGTLLGALLRAYAGPALDSIYVVSFWDPSVDPERSGPFVRRFREVNGIAPNHGNALAYDAVMLLATAARAVGPNRRAIRQWLDGLGRTRPAYQGVTGPIGFRGAVRRPLLMTRWASDAEQAVVVAEP